MAVYGVRRSARNRCSQLAQTTQALGLGCYVLLRAASLHRPLPELTLLREPGSLGRPRHTDAAPAPRAIPHASSEAHAQPVHAHTRLDKPRRRIKRGPGSPLSREISTKVGVDSAFRNECKEVGGVHNAKTHSWGLIALLSVCQWCYQPPLNVIWRCQPRFTTMFRVQR